MEITMKLTPEQEAILNGSKGEAMAKVMRPVPQARSSTREGRVDIYLEKQDSIKLLQDT